MISACTCAGGQVPLLAWTWLECRARPPRQRPQPPLQLTLRHTAPPPLMQLPLPILGRPLAVVECVRCGGRVRVRPASAGFDTALWCQFPRKLRQEGARYLVQDLHHDPRGFYHVVGPIRLLSTTPALSPDRGETHAHP